jgi:hypothetical protein
MLCSEILAVNIMLLVDMVSKSVNAHKCVKVYYTQTVPPPRFGHLFGLLQDYALKG